MGFEIGDTVKVKKSALKFLDNGKGYILCEDWRNDLYIVKIQYRRTIILPNGGLSFPNIQLTKMVLLEKKWDLK